MKHYDNLLKLLRGKHESELNDSELAALTYHILSNYKTNGAILISIEIAISKSKNIAPFRLLLDSAKFGANLEIPNSITNQNIRKLLNILIIGINSGADVTNNLEEFHTLLTKSIDDKNRIKAKTDGMRIISLLGVVFFFPLFSGIAAGISLASNSSLLSRSIADGIRTICIAYITTILLITNFFLNPLRSFFESLRSTIPLLLLACIFQSGAFYFASYAI